VRETVKKGQKQRLTMQFWQGGYSLSYFLLDDDIQQLSRCGHAVWRSPSGCHQVQWGPASGAPEFVNGTIADEPQQPGPWGAARTVNAGMTPDQKKDLLGKVSRLVVVSQHGQCQRKHLRGITLVQHFERLRIMLGDEGE
jgi:hypothetical protein